MYIKVKVLTDQKKESIKETSENRFLVSVKNPAKNNSANGRLIEIFAEKFSLSKNKIRIISGHHSPSKIFSVEK